MVAVRGRTDDGPVPKEEKDKRMPKIFGRKSFSVLSGNTRKKFVLLDLDEILFLLVCLFIFCARPKSFSSTESLALKTKRNNTKQKEYQGVEITGFEPVASRMQSERSTTELYPLTLFPTLSMDTKYKKN